MQILATNQLNAFLRRRRMALDRAEAVARPIIADVRRRGDRALAEYARKFDGYDGPLALRRDDMSSAWSATPAELRAALRVSSRNVQKFARLQKPKSWIRTVAPGVRAGQTVLPLASA